MANSKKLILICIGLVLITITAYWSIGNSQFINFDDNVYVYENGYVQSGLSWNSVKWTFSAQTTRKSGNWHPIHLAVIDGWSWTFRQQPTRISRHKSLPRHKKITMKRYSIFKTLCDFDLILKRRGIVWTNCWQGKTSLWKVGKTI